jgi:uncharacterized protein YbjT (DUF2867 family)
MADTILVVGATGMQGGGVARHLLRRGTIKVRCLTRRPDSEAARLLQQQGAEVVQADLDDIASIRRAVHGCKGVFGVTDFWEAYFREYDQGVPKRLLFLSRTSSFAQHRCFTSLRRLFAPYRGQ